MVCLHGLTRNSADFEEVAPDLAKRGRRVIVPDVRGRGRSERDPTGKSYNPVTYAQDIAGLCEHLGIPQAVFVGTSMGGIVTMVLAVQQPSLVSAVVLNDSGAEFLLAGLQRIASYVGQTSGSVSGWPAAVEYAKRTNSAAFPDNDASQWERFARRIFREDATGVVTLDYDPAIASAIPQHLDAAPDLWSLYEATANDRPVMLIRGEISDIIDAGIAARMRARTPHLVEAVVPRVGHAPMLTEPEARLALEAFLDDVA